MYRYEYTMKVLYEVMEYFENYILKKKKIEEKSEVDINDYEKADYNFAEF
jgi:hypothetical protein